MINKLIEIIQQKKIEVAQSYQHIAQHPEHAIAKIMRGEITADHSHPFKQALNSSSLAVIAEIKRKSPSKGMLAQIPDAMELAQRYSNGGANALSILTDKKFFLGDIEDIIQVKENLTTPLPILRKDFIIDEIQIAEALFAGANAVLCIVAVLGNETKKMIDYAHSLNLDVLVEIHDEEELTIAIDSGADIIGVNNRNLNTFVVDINQSLKMVDNIPKSIIKVAESGITSPDIAHKYHRAGFNAVLIGEALVKSREPEKFIMECRSE